MGDSLRKLRSLESGAFSRWNVIPNISTAGSYSFSTQIIELCDCSSLDFVNAHNGVPGALAKVFPLLAHEQRHYLDHVATLWGQRILSLGYDALHARISNDEQEFWRIVKFRQELRDNRFERYYTRVYGTIPRDGVRVWKYQFSTGNRFDANGKPSEWHPILFTRFAWPDNSPACRTPLSVSSLLETSAMYAEFLAEDSLISSLPGDQQQSAYSHLQHKYLDHAYTPELAEYSVAAHAAGNLIGLKTIPEAYRAASLLAGLSLNLTDAHFDKLKVPQDFRDDWDYRNDAFIHTRDRGYAFLVFCRNAPQELPADPVPWLEATLDRSGLPPLSQFKADTAKAIEMINGDRFQGKFDKYRSHHLLTGRAIFAEFGPVLDFEKISERVLTGKIKMPPIVFGGDLSIAAAEGIVPWDQTPIGSFIDQVLDTYTRCSEFAEACGT